MMTEVETTSADEKDSVLNAVFQVYREDGYRQGYRQSLDDLLGWLVPVTEQYLRRSRTPRPDERQLLYGFVELLEKRITAASTDGGYVMGGLGI